MREKDIGHMPMLISHIKASAENVQIYLEGYLQSYRTNLLQDPKQVNLQNLRLPLLIHSLKSCYLVLEIFRIQGLKTGSSLAT